MFKTNAQSTVVTGARMNTAVYGTTIPFLIGRARITGKLIWQNDFSYYMSDQGKKGKNAQSVAQTSQ